LTKGDLGGFKDLQTEGINGKHCMARIDQVVRPK
jgi:hypothetical protein